MLHRSIAKFCAAPPAIERAVEMFDAVIVGGGPAGLSAAIRLKQLAGDNENFRVALVDKGSEIGAHTLSGACIETSGLDELLPDWKTMEGNPIQQSVTSDSFYYLTKTSQVKSPFLPGTLHNDGNFIVSLGAVCKWLGEHAESLGVEIFPGFAAKELVFDEKTGHLEGIQLGDMGVSKKGEPTAQFEPGMIFKAKQTIFAEGCRGSCTKKLETAFALRDADNHQTYGLGVKEVWEVPKENFKPGQIVHTAGWPLTKEEHHNNTYGGSFMYHYGDGLMSTGFVVGLDYENPHTRPYMEFQKWKTHPFVREFFKDAKPLFYGARTLVEGGLTSLPKLSFPGGALVGDCAGFLNMPKIKGTHCAMKSGTLAAEAVYEDILKQNPGDYADGAFGGEAKSYEERFKSSWLYKELYTVRNCRQVFAKDFLLGMLYTGITTTVTKGMEPMCLKHHAPDHKCTKPSNQCRPIEYPTPDGKLTFDLLTNHSRSGTNHSADQPSHLQLKHYKMAQEVNLRRYDGPEGKYCPAGVYEFVDKEGLGNKRLVVNPQNCLHCKACDIKDPTQNITWTCPEGGGGPNYSGQM